MGAAHVVADPLATGRPVARGGGRLGRDAGLSAATCGTSGLSVAEAMDTAQRGMGLDWPTSRELIRRSMAEARAVGAADRIACGAGTDHLAAGDRRTRSTR